MAGRPTIEILPLGITIEAQQGESIMQAAIRAGYRWPTVCGGQGACHTCYLRIIAGSQDVTPVEACEREGLLELQRVLSNIDQVRLACQARPTGPVVVEKRGVRRQRQEEQ